MQINRLLQNENQQDRSTFADVEAERSSLFTSHRGARRGRGVTTTRGRGRTVYGGGSSFAQRNRQASYVPTASTRPYQRRTGSATTTKPPYTVKEVILLDSSTQKVTIRSAKKAELSENGEIVLFLIL